MVEPAAFPGELREGFVHLRCMVLGGDPEGGRKKWLRNLSLETGNSK